MLQNVIIMCLNFSQQNSEGMELHVMFSLSLGGIKGIFSLI